MQELDEKELLKMLKFGAERILTASKDLKDDDLNGTRYGTLPSRLAHLPELRAVETYLTRSTREKPVPTLPVP